MKFSENRADSGWKALTARERDVIHPVAEGKSNKLIASVEAHRARIFHKMGVRNAAQLARTVCISPEPPLPSEPGFSRPNDLGWIPDQVD